MKYYFITYQAENKQGSISIWNDVIKGSLMEFILQSNAMDSTYNNFVILNHCEITKEEYNKYNSSF